VRHAVHFIYANDASEGEFFWNDASKGESENEGEGDLVVAPSTCLHFALHYALHCALHYAPHDAPHDAPHCAPHCRVD
jgi:hypothetical protein